MLFDANDADRSPLDQPFDVCIAGAGPAGITLARALAARGLKVALLEGGDLDITHDSQDLYTGDNVGLDYYDPYVSRLRFFGGTSNHWGGRCRPLDATDFEAVAYNPLSGWPIAKADLDPYQAATESILDIEPAAGFPDIAVRQETERFRQILWRWSDPVVRFGEKYRDEIAASAAITCFHNANLVDLRLDQTLSTVEAAIFRSFAPGDPGIAVRARRYVLCLGGLENPRFLLNCSSQIPTGIGNRHDLVGRYFQEHPHFHVGDVEFEKRQPAFESYSPTSAFMRENRILNFALWLEPDQNDLSFRREVVRSAKCASSFTERLAERILGSGLPCGPGGLGEYFRAWREEGLTGRLRIVTEQSLIAESRVLLGEERDAFGLRRLRLDWRLGAIDVDTIRVATLAFAEHMAEQRIGRIRLRDWLLAEDFAFPGIGAGQGGVGGQHHMGTTRMSDDPRRGVVDRDCRVHDVRNLFLGGSSVFATGGHANPTYTIVQLALRLADHLAEETA